MRWTILTKHYTYSRSKFYSQCENNAHYGVGTFWCLHHLELVIKTFQ